MRATRLPLAQRQNWLQTNGPVGTDESPVTGGPSWPDLVRASIDTVQQRADAEPPADALHSMDHSRSVRLG